MSIAKLLEQAIVDGALKPIAPRLVGAPTNRFLYGSPEVMRLVEGPWSDEAEEYRCGKLWADFDRFIEGRLISVALNNPYKHPKATYLSRLDPSEDEVWEIRSRDPKPGMRVFGRFIHLDQLALFGWCNRKYLGGPGSDQFKREMRRCIAEWRKIFLTYPPHSGTTVNDYVSQSTISV